MKISWILALTVFLGFSAMAPLAQANGNVGDMPCKDLASGDEELAQLVFAWADGYVNGQGKKTTLSAEWTEKFGGHLGEYCAKNQGKTVLDAIKAGKDL